MEIIIEKDKHVTSSFISWIIMKIKCDILSKLNKPQLRRLTKYINDNNLFDLNQRIDARIIVHNMTNHIEKIETDKLFIIKFNDSLRFLNSKYFLIDILKFIDYGNLDIEGFNQISLTFGRIQNNIEKLKRLYYNGALL